jgi:hypothetical protein
MFIFSAFAIFYEPGFADERNFAKTWNSWGELEKANFVWGYREGSRRIMLGAALIYEPGGTPPAAGSKSEDLWHYSHLRYEVKDIIPIITMLYADTANALISLPDIIPIAEMKLNGEDIKKELENYRNRWRKRPTEEEIQKSASKAPNKESEKSVPDTLNKSLENSLEEKSNE